SRTAIVSQQKAFRLFLTVAFFLFLLGLLPTAVLLLWGPELFGIVLGSNWKQSGAIAAILAPRVVSHLVVSPLSRVVLIYEAQELKLAYNVVTVITILVVYAIGFHYSWAVLTTLLVYTIAQVCLHVIYFGLLSYVVSRRGLPASGRTE